MYTEEQQKQQEKLDELQLEKKASEFDDKLCYICYEKMIAPVLTECNHNFCRYCLTCIHNKDCTNFKDKDKIYSIDCPYCRTKITARYDFDKIQNAKMIEYMKNQIEEENKEIKNPFAGVYEGSAKTVNNYDGNETITDFFHIFVDTKNQFKCDVPWLGGSVHDSYYEVIGRVQGELILKDEKQVEFLAKNVKYTNGPHEDWSGVFEVSEDQNKKLNLKCSNGKYLWYGWDNRVSQGILHFNLKKLL